MINITKQPQLAQKNMPLGIVQVKYPPKDSWQTKNFRALIDAEIASLKEKYADYDRKAVFGDNPYSRFFKKFKKTYPVMLQLESILLKDRPFPDFNPVSEVAFLTEITTLVLSGAHDADCIDGGVTLYLATEKEDFMGMREQLHTYPNDMCARDDSGIIFSMIAGTDSRTCAKTESTNIVYPFFGTPDIDTDIIRSAMDRLCRYVSALAPDAETETIIL